MSLIYDTINKPWVMIPKIRRARRLHTLRRTHVDNELTRFWRGVVAEDRADRRKEMIDSVTAGQTWIIYHDLEHTKPLAAVVPYDVYIRQAETLWQLETIKEADRGDPVRNDHVRDKRLHRG